MSEVGIAEVFGARRTSFGAFATTYDAVRPEWPSATVTWMLGSPTAETVCRVVDLGARDWQGTRAIDALGHDVIAVEASDGMRDALKASLRALPAKVAGPITIVAGGAEDIPIHPERDRILDEVRALGRRVADAHGMVEIPMTTRCRRLRRR